MPLFSIFSLSCCCSPFKYGSVPCLIPPCCCCPISTQMKWFRVSAGRSTNSFISSFNRFIVQHHMTSVCTLLGAATWKDSHQSQSLYRVQFLKTFAHTNNLLCSINICIFFILVYTDCTVIKWTQMDWASCIETLEYSKMCHSYSRWQVMALSQKLRLLHRQKMVDAHDNGKSYLTFPSICLCPEWLHINQ